MNRTIVTAKDWETKSASMTDMFYMLSALTSAYTTEGAEYIDMSKVVSYVYSDLENNRVKIKGDVTDELISGVLCRKVTAEVKKLNEQLDGYPVATLIEKTEILSELIVLLKNITVFVGLNGLEAIATASDNVETRFSINISCDLRGELMGNLALEDVSGGFSCMLCPSHAMAKHQIMGVRTEIKAYQSGELAYTAIVAKRADGTNGIIVYGEKTGTIKATLADFGITWGELGAVRSSN